MWVKGLLRHERPMSLNWPDTSLLSPKTLAPHTLLKSFFCAREYPNILGLQTTGSWAKSKLSNHWFISTILVLVALSCGVPSRCTNTLKGFNIVLNLIFISEACKSAKYKWGFLKPWMILFGPGRVVLQLWLVHNLTSILIEYSLGGKDYNIRLRILKANFFETLVTNGEVQKKRRRTIT